MIFLKIKGTIYREVIEVINPWGFIDPYSSLPL